MRVAPPSEGPSKSVILSEGRVPACRAEDESKDPEDVSFFGVTPSIETVQKLPGYRSLKITRRTGVIGCSMGRS